MKKKMELVEYLVECKCQFSDLNAMFLSDF